jgi:Zn finger protein HypA/HybF involved in hydrogenase expression
VFACKDCGFVFDDSKLFVDTHGLDTPPYEERYGCPKCGGAYAETFKCSSCAKWINDLYIKTEDGERYCHNCYSHMDLGEEFD